MGRTGTEYIGTFDTARAAAVALARHLLQAQEAQSEGGYDREDVNDTSESILPNQRRSDLMAEISALKEAQKKNEEGMKVRELEVSKREAELRERESALKAREDELRNREMRMQAEIEWDADQDADEDEGPGCAIAEIGEEEAEQPQTAAHVTYAEGFQLHLSDRSQTGYRGVTEEHGRFVAQLRVPWAPRKRLGSFDTAVAAAVAFARMYAQSQETNVSGQEQDNEGATEAWKAAGLCGSPGCSYPDFHDGPCSHWVLLDSRKRNRPKSWSTWTDEFVSW